MKSAGELTIVAPGINNPVMMTSKHADKRKYRLVVELYCILIEGILVFFLILFINVGRIIRIINKMTKEYFFLEFIIPLNMRIIGIIIPRISNRIFSTLRGFLSL